jgi:hypothetical protein
MSDDSIILVTSPKTWSIVPVEVVLLFNPKIISACAQFSF